MTVAELLSLLDSHPGGLHLMLPDGDFVPPHFHITEVGRVQKDFIDCGGTVRNSTACVLQVWVADDTDHRLEAAKLAKIIRLATPLLKSSDLPVEVEYETGLVSQYPLTAAEVTPAGLLLHLGTKHTDCLAKDRCGVGQSASGCDPAAGCC
ncbi:MAG: DUF6428 family protein [Fimbriiglobus sp.]|jgi:hypothetical protein|nr:DUF6428 family protein [Fimbriiglobus sp.]